MVFEENEEVKVGEVEEEEEGRREQEYDGFIDAARMLRWMSINTKEELIN